MTNGILKSINMKDKMYKIVIQSDQQDENLYQALKNEFKIYRATLRRSIREAKRLYYFRIFNTFKNDIKKTWSIINDGLKHKVNDQLINKFVVENRTICDPDEIANEFNNYFINIGHNLSMHINTNCSYTDYLGAQHETRFKFHTVDNEHVTNIINKLKNKSSCGHDSISNKLIKRSKEALVEPITILINQMLQTGQFPNELKLSKVKPLFKSGDSSKFSNYLPISLLPSISKIYEYVLFYQLFDYFTINKLFCMHQYGFRPGHSTELAALKLVDHLTKEVDRRNVPINIYIDLSKAFDTLDHTILLDKLSYYGISQFENELFFNYLSERFQYVEYKGSKSESKLISTGVPQGSILGPLLFLIYINDLPMASNMFNMMMYFDDTTLYCNLSQHIHEFEINSELVKVKEWLSSNKLSLIVSKTTLNYYYYYKCLFTQKIQ